MFANEGEFQGKMVDLMGGQGWHVTELNDSLAIGLPDVTAANDHREFWMELKRGSRIFSVHDKMKLAHPLSALQYKWLKQRQATAPNGTHCGVLVYWATGKPDDVIDYVSWVPISKWDAWMSQDLMTMALRQNTARWEWLATGQAPVLMLVGGLLGPGWVGATTRETPRR